MLDQWHEFFMTVGGGAAALTGLVFVAMSLNLKAILQDETHRARAIGSLVGFSAAFVICALALMGDQDYQKVGFEWFVVSGISLFVYLEGYFHSRRSGGSAIGLHPLRIATGTTLNVAQILGACLLFFGHSEGIYLAGIALVMYITFMISAAWLLLVAVHMD